MKWIRFALLVFSFTTLFITNIFAQTDDSAFLTTRDILSNNPNSNISLHNNRNLPATVYGLYVRQFAYVNPGDTCDHANVIYSDNITAGSFVMPTVMTAGRSSAIGSNYLYNMIYQAIYYENIIIPSSPPGCALPGCTWGSDTSIYNWCIYLGALAPVVHTSDYTSSVPPSTDVASSASLYDYNLISHYISLGPIACDDQTLTCMVSNQQTQAFP